MGDSARDLAHEVALDALGDGNRREILRLLADGEQPVHAIAARLPISRPAVSRHLRVLGDAGLVTARADGTRRYYALEAEGLAAVRDYVATVWGAGMARFGLLADNLTEPDASPAAEATDDEGTTA